MVRAIMRFGVPIVFRVMIFTLGIVATTVASLLSGILPSVDRIANEWLDRAVAAGFPTQWDREFYWVLWVIALLTIIIGWIVLALVTVWIIGSIF